MSNTTRLQRGFRTLPTLVSKFEVYDNFSNLIEFLIIDWLHARAMAVNSRHFWFNGLNGRT